MVSKKFGRNEPCPCGSGKKFKKCHGAPHQPRSPIQLTGNYSVHQIARGADGTISEPIPVSRDAVPDAVLQKMMAEMREHERQAQERTRRYGLVRPEIAADFHGYKFVAIGNIMLSMPSERCRFLTDVLLAYVPQLFGKEWFEQEIAKPPDERHPVMQWRVKGMNYFNAQPRLPDGSYGAVPTGPLLAYLTFAYDLYVVAHNARLDTRIVERLKQKDQFQGARHELFAEATCLRAGFKIEHENQDDRKSRHAEFTATHLSTGQKLSVEAKSKHRPGVMAQTGSRESIDSVNLRFGYLLNDAVAKAAAYPLVVFLDMNMPFETANRFLSRPIHPFILKTLNRMKMQHGGKDPITQLIITNHPGHYTKDEEIAPHAHFVGQVSPRPLKPARIEALSAIMQATMLYGSIPQELPKSSRAVA